MKKQYLVPVEIVMEGDIPVNTPKYIVGLGINWAGCWFEDKQMFMITADIDDKQHAELITNDDVIDLETNDAKTRAAISQKMGLSSKGGDNLVDKLIKKADPKASSADLKIGDKIEVALPIEEVQIKK